MTFEFDTGRCILIIVILALALFGSHARYVFDHGKLEWRSLLAEYVVGLFTGLCVFYLVSSTDKIGKELKYFCVVMSGFCARDIVKFISYAFIERFKKFLGSPTSPVNQIPENKAETKEEPVEKK